jgi:hypothetical protein
MKCNVAVDSFFRWMYGTVCGRLECQCSRFQPCVVTRLNTVFFDLLLLVPNTGIRSRGRPVRFHHSRNIEQIAVSSDRVRVSLIEVHCFCVMRLVLSKVVFMKNKSAQSYCCLRLFCMFLIGTAQVLRLNSCFALKMGCV